MFWVGLFVGVVAGAMAGIATMCILTYAKDSDKEATHDSSAQISDDKHADT